jgi:hypothetical protein
MAIGTPNLLGSTITSANATSLALTTTAAAPAGNPIILAVFNTVGTASVVDQDGVNTYSALGTAQTNVVPVQFFITANAPGLASGRTITVSASSGRIGFGAFSVSGLSTTLNAQNGRNQVNTASWTTNAITTTFADCLILGACCNDLAATNTPAGSWPEIFELTPNLYGLVCVYQIVAATGTYTASGTLSAASPDDIQSKIVAVQAVSGTTYDKTGAGVIGP